MKKEDYIQEGYNLGYADGLAHGKLEGKDAAEERIITFLDGWATKLDAMRPESYKSVADMADLRIRTIRKMIELIKEEQS